jgi:hypothetical protein
MFDFIVKHFGFLKRLPFLPHVFETFLRLHSFLFKKNILFYIDDIEKDILFWTDTNTSIHRYGGLQFNYKNHELGHIHGNGLLDVLLSKEIKQSLLNDRIRDHHVFKNSAWVSMDVKTEEEKELAVVILRKAYQIRGRISQYDAVL